jgi:pimeloyl-CoA synthetase
MAIIKNIGVNMFNKKINDTPINEIKEKIRILFIDDQDRKDIIDYLDNEGWKARWITDLKAIDSPDITDTHIICVDIKGVGQKLNKEYEGLDIAASIKKRYPYKKVILYSSQATHDIFHEANSLVDKRIHKSSGDFEVFRNDIEDLSKEVFNWSTLAIKVYTLYRKELPHDLSYEKFEGNLRKIVKESNISESIVSKYIPIAGTVAQIISLILQAYRG